MDDKAMLACLDAYLKVLNSLSFQLETVIAEVYQMRDDVADRLDDERQLPMDIIALPPSNRWAA